MAGIQEYINVTPVSESLSTIPVELIRINRITNTLSDHNYSRISDNMYRFSQYSVRENPLDCQENSQVDLLHPTSSELVSLFFYNLNKYK